MSTLTPLEGEAAFNAMLHRRYAKDEYSKIKLCNIASTAAIITIVAMCILLCVFAGTMGLVGGISVLVLSSSLFYLCGNQIVLGYNLGLILEKKFDELDPILNNEEALKKLLSKNTLLFDWGVNETAQKCLHPHNYLTRK